MKVLLWFQIIRKVNKQLAILDVDEPVSQLHKCALQFKDDLHSYLCLSGDTIVRYQVRDPTNSSCSSTSTSFITHVSSPLPQAPPGMKDSSREVLNDGSCWTIIGVEAVEFTFNQGPACIQTPVTPFPVITSLEVSSSPGPGAGRDQEKFF